MASLMNHSCICNTRNIIRGKRPIPRGNEKARNPSGRRTKECDHGAVHSGTCGSNEVDHQETGSARNGTGRVGDADRQGGKSCTFEPGVGGLEGLSDEPTQARQWSLTAPLQDFMSWAGKTVSASDGRLRTLCQRTYTSLRSDDADKPELTACEQWFQDTPSTTTYDNAIFEGLHDIKWVHTVDMDSGEILENKAFTDEMKQVRT